MAPAVPLVVVVLYLSGWVYSVYTTWMWSCRAREMPAPDVTSPKPSRSGSRSPFPLFAFRAAVATWALGIGLRQLSIKGAHILIFFTVWNWWILTGYFALGAFASFQAWRAAQAGASTAEEPLEDRLPQEEAAAAAKASSPSSPPPLDGGVEQSVAEAREFGIASRAPRGSAASRAPSPWLRRALNAALHVELSSALLLDTITWTVLVPMLVNHRDPAKRAFFRRELFSFESYNQHGLNAVFLLADLALSHQQADATTVGPFALLLSAYGLFASAHHQATGRFIYPFLDFTQSFAVAGYFGTLLVALVAFVGAYSLVYAVGGRGETLPLVFPDGKAYAFGVDPGVPENVIRGSGTKTRAQRRNEGLEPANDPAAAGAQAPQAASAPSAPSALSAAALAGKGRAPTFAAPRIPRTSTEGSDGPTIGTGTALHATS